jgi:hypothetical protein
MEFDRLIRFVDGDGHTVFGNLSEETPLSQIQGLTVQLVKGDLDTGFKRSDEWRTVGKVHISSTNRVHV